MAGLIPGIGPVISGFTTLGKLLISSAESLQKWSDDLLKADFEFAEFSAAMSMVKVRQELREQELSQERGDRRAGAAENLAEGKNDLDRTMAPIGDLFGIVKDNIVADPDRAMAFMLGPLSEVCKWLMGEGEEKGPNAMDTMFDTMQKQVIDRNATDTWGRKGI